MHTGRIAHTDNLPAGLQPVGLSEVRAAGEIFTDSQGPQPHSQPVALDTPGLQRIIEDFVRAARNARRAGFDGVELHGANGYLLEQALNPHVNTRTDAYGGSLVNRARLPLEVAARVAEAIGPERVGIRLSPFSTLSDMPAYNQAEVHQTYAHLSTELSRLGIAYLHISDNPAIPAATHRAIRQAFAGVLIYCNGLTAETAEAKLQDGSADLVAFGRNFLSTPDLVRRIERDEPLNEVDYLTLYTAGAEGYTDYPVLS
jgi:N-ethylmaleimide reductase